MKYGFWIQIRFLREADDRVVKDLHRGRRAFRLRVGRVDRNVACRLERGKHVVANEQLACFPGPVLAERRLHVVHDRAAHAAH